AAVAGVDEQLDVSGKKSLIHRYLRAIRQHGGGIGRSLLDKREDVIPATAVEPGRMLAQLPQKLVHLERCRQRLDEACRLDGTASDPEGRLGVQEHVVPEPRLEVALHLRQVE